jgi:hypothetical protein
MLLMVLLDAALHLVYELPVGAVMPTGAKRGSVRPDHGPHMGRTVPCFHPPAESQSTSTPRAVDAVGSNDDGNRRGRRLGDIASSSVQGWVCQRKIELPPGQKALAAQSGCWGELPTQALDLA